MALIQLGQRQRQSARYQDYHPKNLRNQQAGRMKHLHSFMIGQVKEAFQAIYLDEICYFLYVYVYIVLFIQETYMVLIMHETIIFRLRKIVDD